MSKRKFQLTPKEIDEIQNFMRACQGECLPCKRLNAVLLYGTGHSLAEIQDCAECSRSSVLSWCRDYRDLGIESLVDMRLGGNNAQLSPEQLADLLNHLRTTTPRMAFGEKAASPDGECWTMKDLYRGIKEWYGLAFRSYNSYYRLLRQYKIQTKPRK